MNEEMPTEVNLPEFHEVRAEEVNQWITSLYRVGYEVVTVYPLIMNYGGTSGYQMTGQYCIVVRRRDG